MDGKMSNKSRDIIKLLATLIFVSIVAGLVIFIDIKKYNDHRTTDAPVTTEEEINASANIKANEKFAMNFLKQEYKQSNFIYSPLSVKYALNMLKDGADGNTKKQIQSLLKDTTLAKYQNIENILSLANAIYIRDKYADKISPDYTKTLQEKYNAEVKIDPFASAQNINYWIEQKTYGEIKNMLQDETVTDSDALAILINALAIDMEWAQKFDSKNTSTMKFKTEEDENYKTASMNQKLSGEDFSYYDDDEILSISGNLKKYNDTQLEFAAIMPKKEKLSEFIQNLKAGEIQQINDKLTTVEKSKEHVRIHLPRFEYDYKFSLKEDLKKLGVTDAFSQKAANFENIKNKQKTDEDINFYVNEALHKANFKFSEKGIKAAAVTVIELSYGTSIDKTEWKDLTLNQPFLYLVRDKSNDEIWFIGTVYKPTNWDDIKSDYQISH